MMMSSTGPIAPSAYPQRMGINEFSSALPWGMKTLKEHGPPKSFRHIEFRQPQNRWWEKTDLPVLTGAQTARGHPEGPRLASGPRSGSQTTREMNPRSRTPAPPPPQITPQKHKLEDFEPKIKQPTMAAFRILRGPRRHVYLDSYGRFSDFRI